MTTQFVSPVSAFVSSPSGVKFGLWRGVGCVQKRPGNSARGTHWRGKVGCSNSHRPRFLCSWDPTLLFLLEPDCSLKGPVPLLIIVCPPDCLSSAPLMARVRPPGAHGGPPDKPASSKEASVGTGTGQAGDGLGEEPGGLGSKASSAPSVASLRLHFPICSISS